MSKSRFSWLMGMWVPMLCMGMVRYIDDPGGGGGGAPGGGGGGGGGEPWYGNEIQDAGLKETLGSFKTRDEAFTALHESRVNGSKPLVDRILAEDKELEPFRDKLAEFDKLSKLAKSYVELQKKLGKNPLVPLGEKATDAEKKAFRDQLAVLAGRPESPDKYTYKPADEVVAAGLNMELFNGRMKQFHEAGMSDEHVSLIMKAWEEEAGMTGESMDRHLIAQADEAREWSKTEWGADAEKNRQLAGRAMRKTGVYDKLKASGLINDKDIIRDYYAMAQAIGEGNLPDEKASGGDAKSELDALLKDPAYLNARLRVGPKANIMERIMQLRQQIK